MQPDERELAALRCTVEAFDKSYVALMQAVNRIIRIYELPETTHQGVDLQGETGSVLIKTFSEQKIKVVVQGETCPRCHGMKIVRVGGCGRCMECNYDMGCGG